MNKTINVTGLIRYYDVNSGRHKMRITIGLWDRFKFLLLGNSCEFKYRGMF